MRWDAFPRFDRPGAGERAERSSRPDQETAGLAAIVWGLTLGPDQFLPDLVSGDREFDVIAPVDEHSGWDGHDIRPNPERPLNLGDDNGFAIADPGLGNQANQLAV